MQVLRENIVKQFAYELMTGFEFKV